jgi:hypothetical protein
MSDGTSFDGNIESEVFRERFSTKRMLEWVREHDTPDAESGRAQSRIASEEEDDSDEFALGPRAARLLEIAELVGAEHCRQCLLGLAAGSWTPTPQAPTIVRITGVALRPVQIQTGYLSARTELDPVFTVVTSAGPAFLYPPSIDWYAHLVLTPGRGDKVLIRVPKKWLPALASWRSQLMQLSVIGSDHPPKVSGRVIRSR